MPTNPNSIGNPFGESVSWGPTVLTAQERRLAAAEARREAQRAREEAEARRKAAKKAENDRRRAEKDAAKAAKAPATRLDIDTIFGAIGDVIRNVTGLQQQVGDATGLNEFGSPKALGSPASKTTGKLNKFAPLLIVAAVAGFVWFTTRNKRN